MAFKRSFSPVLDGGLVAIGDGTVRTQTVKIESGEYTPPIWLRTEDGLVVPVGSLPYQGRLPCGSIEVLSESPLPQALVFASSFTSGLGTGQAARRDTTRARPFTQAIFGSSEVKDGGLALGFPMATYLEAPNAFCQTNFFSTDGYVPTPAVGHKVGFRCIFTRSMFTWTGPTEGGTHGMYFMGPGQTGFGPNVAGFVLDLQTDPYWIGVVCGQNMQGVLPDFQFRSPVGIPKSAAVRIELLYTRTATLSYTLGCRLFIGANVQGTTPDYDSANGDFRGRDNNTNLHGMTFSHAATTGIYSPEGITGLTVGAEGAEDGTGALYGYSGFAITAGASAGYPGKWRAAENDWIP